MRLYEFESPLRGDNSGELAALSQFLIGRADDQGSTKTISIGAFLKAANDMGISLTRDQLISQSQEQPLNNLIQNVTDDEVVFKGSEEPDDTMSVDQARDTVDSMAKRASSKKGR